VQGHSESNRELLDAAALCRQLVPEGTVEAFLADHRHELFPDEMFEDLFPSGRGRPSIPAEVVASVMVLQALEGLSDRDAARALWDRISWKVACGLALDDEGFDFSVLTYWRARLRKSEQPERIFDAVRSVIDATGILKGKTRRALDSTLLDDAVATQDTVTQLIAAIRRVRRVVLGARDVTLSAHDYESAGKPLIAWDDPVAKAALVDGLVTDALSLLGAFEHIPEDTDATSALGLPWSLAKTSNKATTAPGGSPRKWPLSGSFPLSTPKPGTCTSHVLSTATATRPTSPSSPRPAWLPPVRSPQPTPLTGRPASSSSPARNPGSRYSGTAPMEQERCSLL
jgi:transposase